MTGGLRNWRRNLAMLLLLIEGDVLIAALLSPFWLDMLVSIAYSCGLAFLLYGDFAKSAYDTMRLEKENELLKDTNERLAQLHGSKIYSSDK